MMRINEMFYGSRERPQFMVQTSAQQIIRDARLFTQELPPPAKAPAAPPAEKNKPIVMRVSICCSSCVDLIKHDIMNKAKGVKDVECDVFRKKVTVTGTAALADVISAARRRFKDAELWD